MFRLKISNHVYVIKSLNHLESRGHLTNKEIDGFQKTKWKNIDYNFENE